MSKVLVSSSLPSSGAGNGRGVGSVSEGGDWGEGEIISDLANCISEADAGAGIESLDWSSAD